jgi:hypothetical protein
MDSKNYKLPAMEYRFSIEIEGEETGHIWKGEFLYKRPTIGQRGQINVMKTRLSGDLRNVDLEASIFHEALSHLRYTIHEYPKWWNESDFGASLYDGNVVVEIYNKCIEFEANWKKRANGGDSKDVEVRSGEAQAADILSTATNTQSSAAAT